MKRLSSGAALMGLFAACTPPSVTIDPDPAMPIAPTLGSLSATGGEDGPVLVDWRVQAADEDGTATALSVASVLLQDAPGALTVLPDGSLSYDPQGAFNALRPGQSVTVVATLVVQDADGLTSAPATLAITLNGENDAPIVASQSHVIATNTLDAVTIAFASLPVSDPDSGDMLALTDVSTPTLAAVATGAAALSGGDVHFTPAHPDSGAYVVAFTVADEAGASASGTVTVDVRLGVQASISSFSAARATVPNGRPTTLTWSSSDAADCTVSTGDEVLGSGTSGSTGFAPAATTSVTLSCDGDGDPVVQTLPIAWVPAYFVVPTAQPPEQDGLSWETAFDTIQKAIDDAGGAPVQIWVRQGTYFATSRSPIATMTPGIKLYGGFNPGLTGTNGSLHEDDRYSVSMLDGEAGAPGYTDNALHVVVGASGGVLDKFYVQNGWADGADDGSRGGGVLIRNASSFVINNVTFYNNSSEDGSTPSEGGAVYADNVSNLTISNCTFDSNRAWGFYGTIGTDGQPARGGGVFVSNSGLTVTSSTFDNNEVAGGSGQPPTISAGTAGKNGAGGGIYATLSSVTLDQVTFTDNKAWAGVGGDGLDKLTPYSGAGGQGQKGGSASGGGVALVDNPQVTLTAVTFDGCSATGEHGGEGGNGHCYSLLGPCSSANPGGAGGPGGNGYGGSIFITGNGNVSLDVSVQNSLAQGGGDYYQKGGQGSKDAVADATNSSGTGGVGGVGGNAFGGGIYLDVPTGTVSFNAVSITGSVALGGNGGPGGDGGQEATTTTIAGTAGVGGPGGDAYGGGLFCAQSYTLTGGAVTGNTADNGAGGSNGQGTSPGILPINGREVGGGVYSYTPGVVIDGTDVSGNTPDQNVAESAPG